MSAKTGVPSGMSMMLKALGIDLDPNMIKDVAGAVTGIHTRMEAMDRKLDKIMKHLGVSDERDSISDGSDGSSSGDGSSSSLVSSRTDSRKN